MSLWNEDEAKEAVKKWPALPELALRVYSSRLIGRDSSLVLHGGGNTSVKLKVANKIGEEVEVLAVKGSGWDLSNIEPKGFPMVDLAHCRKLIKLPELSDEDMVTELRSRMLDFSSPTPSVEALLHAYIPHKYVDHSHAVDAILAVADQPDDRLVREIFGNELGIVHYVMPGFILAKKVAEVFDANPNVNGLLLMKHGLFTWGETAHESYENHVKFVEMARSFVKHKGISKSLAPQSDPRPSPPYEILRGVLFSFSNGRHWVLQKRTSLSIMEFVNSNNVSNWSQRGTCTPDHVIRTKAFPMLLVNWPALENPANPSQKDVKVIAEYIREEVQQFVGNYIVYFNDHNTRSPIKKKQLDPLPRLVLMAGIGLIAMDFSIKSTTIALDIYEHSIETIKAAESVGTYSPVAMADLWDMEYWTLEQAKLGTSVPKALDGQIVAVTGGASGIGLACVKEFLTLGAHVFVMDNRDAELTKALQQCPAGQTQGHVVDVCDEKAVISTLNECIALFGGLDIIISNAGAPWQGPIGPATSAMRQSFELNFWAHQYCASHAVNIFMMQNEGAHEDSMVPMGGCLLFNTSKATVNPGPNFGPYAVAKAATLALMKQYALDYGSHNIRANAVNADRVRTQFFSADVIESRARARGLTSDSYFRSNLLEQEVTANDVAQEFAHLALAMRTTAGIATVDGGNIAASLR